MEKDRHYARLGLVAMEARLLEAAADPKAAKRRLREMARELARLKADHAAQDTAALFAKRVRVVVGTTLLCYPRQVIGLDGRTVHIFGFRRDRIESGGLAFRFGGASKARTAAEIWVATGVPPVATECSLRECRRSDVSTSGPAAYFYEPEQERWLWRRFRTAKSRDAFLAKHGPAWEDDGVRPPGVN